MIFKHLFLSTLISLMLTGCATHGKFRPANPMSAGSYVTLYGMESCPACQRFKKALEKENVSYTFKDIKDDHAKNEMFSRMQAVGLEGRFLYPIVDVNGEVASYPSVDDTLERYRRSLKV